MGSKIALGAAAKAAVGTATKPQTIEEKLDALQRQVDALTQAFHAVNSVRIKDKRREQTFENVSISDANRDGLPIGLSLMGVSMRGGIHVLQIRKDGYYIGTAKFASLSAAAEAASGVRRSGWTYWKLADGRTVKEAFGKK